MESLYKTTPLLETVTRYIQPEMSILLSGYRFSYLPFPLFVNAEFTGKVTMLSDNNQYYMETCVDRGLRIKSTERSRFVYPIPFETDFIMISNTIAGKNNVTTMFSELQNHVKSGGYMLLICSELEQKNLLNTICNLDFELIEVFNTPSDYFLLIKKGWPEMGYGL